MKKDTLIFYFLFEEIFKLIEFHISFFDSNILTVSKIFTFRVIFTIYIEVLFVLLKDKKVILKVKNLLTKEFSIKDKYKISQISAIKIEHYNELMTLDWCH